MPSKPAVSMFGTPLHQLLENQKKEYPKLDIPYVAYYLINHFKKIGGIPFYTFFQFIVYLIMIRIEIRECIQSARINSGSSKH